MQGLVHILQAGDGLTWGILIGLLLMSITSWTLICLKSIELWALSRWYRKNPSLIIAPSAEPGYAVHAEAPKLEGLLSDSGLASCTDSPADSVFPSNLPPTAIQPLWQVGQWAAGEYAQRCMQSISQAQDWLHHILRRARDESRWRLQSGLGILASIGATAPFVGLLGTVWGIYHALSSMGAQQVAAERSRMLLDTIAGPVGESLVMTALGLGVAIPAIVAYNAFARAQAVFMLRLNEGMREISLEVTHTEAAQGAAARA